ncbi:hypothetical protein THS27_21535 [Thalassospira sp. MCCC 1A01428]|nr:hypothetical protein THS27_21535 [Thalassospira sp. MCCC 1A01428]
MKLYVSYIHPHKFAFFARVFQLKVDHVLTGLPKNIRPAFYRHYLDPKPIAATLGSPGYTNAQ